MSLISNNDFPDEHVTHIAEALSKASQDNYSIAKFIKKEKLTINYNQIVSKFSNYNYYFIFMTAFPVTSLFIKAYKASLVSSILKTFEIKGFTFFFPPF